MCSDERKEFSSRSKRPAWLPESAGKLHADSGRGFGWAKRGPFAWRNRGLSPSESIQPTPLAKGGVLCPKKRGDRGSGRREARLARAGGAEKSKGSFPGETVELAFQLAVFCRAKPEAPAPGSQERPRKNHAKNNQKCRGGEA